MKTKLFKAQIWAVLLALLISSSCKKELALSNSKVPPAGAVAQQAANGKMVLFPGRGWVPASQVHIIDRNSYLQKQNGHIYRMEKKTNKMVEDYGEYKKPAPAGQSLPASNITKNLASRSLMNSGQKPQPPLASGTSVAWVDYANWKNPQISSPINYFATTWTVPGAPDSVASQSIFIFNGLQDTTANGDVLQAVLGWGPAAGIITGNYWFITNTYSTNGPTPYYFSTAPDTVTIGASLTGVITYTGSHSPDNSYNYTSSFSGYTNNVLTLVEGTNFSTEPAPHKGNAPYIPELNLACETLEAYTLGSQNPPQSPNLYPEQDSIPMKNINLKVNNLHPTLSWTTAFSTDTIAGQKAHVISNSNPGGRVDLYFHSNQRPIISFPAPDSIGLTKNAAATPVTPINSGGEATFTISPALPAGVTINSANGTISGTPTVTSVKTTYTITATNYAGHSSATFSMRVWPAPVITAGYQGHNDLYTFTVTPNIPSPTTGVLYWKDLTNGTNGDDAGSPYGFNDTFTAGHQYQVYFIEYGGGLPQNAKSNTVSFTAL